MSLDLSLVFNDAVWLLGIVCLYIVGKALAVYTVARITKLDRTESVGRMTIMAHGGEFAFVLFSAATTAGVMTKDQNATFTAAVIISMLFSPLIGLLMRKINQRKSANQEEKVDTSDLDPIVDLEDSVLVIGFGRFSQIVCQSLLVRGINVSVIDRNIENIRAAAKFGFKVYYGDGIRLDVLRAAGIEKAKCVVIGINDTQRIENIVQNLKDAYPKLPILARTYDRKTTVSLIKRDVDFIVRETFESALTLSHATLMQLGVNKIEADEVIAEVRYLDQERLNEEVLWFSTDIIRKYWMPKPFVKPHSDAEALNEETAEILEKKMTPMTKQRLKPFFMMILKPKNKKKSNNKKPDKSLSGFCWPFIVTIQQLWICLLRSKSSGKVFAEISTALNPNSSSASKSILKPRLLFENTMVPLGRKIRLRLRINLM